MSVKYIQLTVLIHGLDMDDKEAVSFLKGWVREATKAGLLGHQRAKFKFRDEFESDIEVELEEFAGEFRKTDDS